MIDYILLEEYAKNKAVLFVEDDENIRKETKELLDEIFPIVDIASDGEEGLTKYLNYKNINGKFYDMIITDIKMPNKNGIELAKDIYKENNNQLLIVLSAHSESEYLLELVNIGISHFIVKPLEYENFIHIIFTKLKELHLNSNTEIDTTITYINKDLTWNKKTKQLISLENENIKLTKKEILLIDLLLKYSEKTHTVEEIFTYLWDEDTDVTDISNLKNIISRLRKKVPSLSIENVYGFGYRINLK